MVGIEIILITKEPSVVEAAMADGPLTLVMTGKQAPNFVILPKNLTRLISATLSSRWSGNCGWTAEGKSLVRDAPSSSEFSSQYPLSLIRSFVHAGTITSM